MRTPHNRPPSDVPDGLNAAFKKLLLDAAYFGATEIHILSNKPPEKGAPRVRTQVRFLAGGVQRGAAFIDPEESSEGEMVRRIKAWANLASADEKFLRKGEMTVEGEGRSFVIRVSAFPGADADTVGLALPKELLAAKSSFPFLRWKPWR